MKWCTVTGDGYRTSSVHWARKHGAVGEVDKRVVAKKLRQRSTEREWRQGSADSIISQL